MGRGDEVERAVLAERRRCADVAYTAAGIAEGYGLELAARLVRRVGRTIMAGPRVVPVHEVGDRAG